MEIGKKVGYAQCRPNRFHRFPFFGHLPDGCLLRLVESTQGFHLVFDSFFGSLGQFLFFDLSRHLRLNLCNHILIGLFYISQRTLFIDVLLNDFGIFLLQRIQSLLIFRSSFLCLLQLLKQTFRLGLLLGAFHIEFLRRFAGIILFADQHTQSSSPGGHGGDDGSPWSGGKCSFKFKLRNCSRFGVGGEFGLGYSQQFCHQSVCFARHRIGQRKSLFLLLGSNHSLLRQF